MSAIFGIFNLDGRPVDRDHLEAMRDAMVGWGPDGAAIWSDGPIGLGHLMMHNTPESVGENPPLRRPVDDIVLTAGARIDNRAELFRELDVPAGQRVGMGDGELILRAYEKWETELPARLVGDWAVAVWDDRRRQLLLARDHFGVTGLYVHCDERRCVFASSVTGLFAVADVPRRPNRTRVVASGFVPRDPAETYYEEIRQLRPAHAMTVSSSGTECWKYWDPSDVPEIRYDTDQEYVDAFTEIYTEAVRCRLRSHRPVGTMLSGGLDSGSIAAVAARLVEADGQRLSAFTGVPLHDATATTPGGRVADESDNARAICDAAGNIDLNVVRADSRTPLQAMRECLNIHGEPVWGPNVTWSLELFETAQRQNLGALLDGWGGNLTASWEGNRRQYLLSLLRNRAWGSYLRDVSARRHDRKLPWWRAGADIVRPLIPIRWIRRVRYRAAFRDDGPGTKVARGVLRSDPEVVPTHQLSNDVRNPGLHRFFETGGAVTALSFELGAAFGLEIRQPAMDKRVIEFCQGIPLDQFTRLGRDRLLLRRAMSGLLPDHVLWDTGRGVQSADIAQRLQADEAELRRALCSLESSGLAQELLNLPRMRVALDTICSSLDQHSMFEGVLLWRILAKGLFLQTFENE